MQYCNMMLWIVRVLLACFDLLCLENVFHLFVFSLKDCKAMTE